MNFYAVNYEPSRSCMGFFSIAPRLSDKKSVACFGPMPFRKLHEFFACSGEKKCNIESCWLSGIPWMLWCIIHPVTRPCLFYHRIKTQRPSKHITFTGKNNDSINFPRQYREITARCTSEGVVRSWTTTGARGLDVNLVNNETPHRHIIKNIY